MSDEAPRLDPRRTADFAAELQERARAWIPRWGLADGEGDFGRALLDIAARFSSDVAERLDGAGDKMRRGFLDWLAVRGEAARPARMPVVFQLADAARTAVLAEAPVRLQADAGGASVTFETERDVRIVPGRVGMLVAVDAAEDAFYLAPPGLTDLEPLEAAPTRWSPKSFVAAGETKFQLDPEGGLVEGTVITAAGHEYRVVAADKDLVTITPPLDTELSPDIVVTKGDRFAPFDGVARNWQAHALLLGDAELLNIEAEATIEVVGAGALVTGVAWQYWGKVDGLDEVDWQPLTVAKLQPFAGSVLLEKGKGAVEIKDIAGRSGRWIRAYRATSEAMVQADEFSIRINADGCKAGPVDPPDADDAPPAAEGMANTTPLVLENVFFPLGREPRQFDAFYLGSMEVFSKAKAKVSLHFEIAERRFAALAASRSGPFADRFLAGVGADGHLHLLNLDASNAITRFAQREALRPPLPAAANAPPAGSTPVALDPKPDYRPPVWSIGSTIYTAVAAGNAVWIWQEDTLAVTGGWFSTGLVVAENDPTKRITGLVHLTDGTTHRLFALRDLELYSRDPHDPNDAWRRIPTETGAGVSVALRSIAAITSHTQNFDGDLLEGLLGTAGDPAGAGIVFRVDIAGTEGRCRQVLDEIASDVAPAGARRADGMLVVAGVGKRAAAAARTIRARRHAPTGQVKTETAKLETAAVIGHAVDVNLVKSTLVFTVCLDKGTGGSEVATWTPFATPADKMLRTSMIPSSAGTPAGAPTLLTDRLLVPTNAGEVIVASFNPLTSTFAATPESVVITASPNDRLRSGDQVSFQIDDGSGPRWNLEAILDEGVEFRGRRYHRFADPAIADDLHVFKQGRQEFVGSTTLADPDELTLDVDDVEGGITQEGDVLRIETANGIDAYEVTDVTAGVATLDPPLNLDTTDPPPPIAYQAPVDSDAMLRPLLALSGLNRVWDEDVLDRVRLQFPDAEPEQQRAFAFKRDTNGHPELVALDEFWTTPPPLNTDGTIDFIVDASIGEWTRQLTDASTNPELSWEYWNGTGWWTLGRIQDNTLNLKRTAAVTFNVPDDLRISDWSGKTNFWIRARLVGGDYGQEKVTITSTTTGNKTEQTIQRSTDGIRAPSVLALRISYALCEPTRPTFVLSQDSGSIRDQSDANLTPGAIVDTFIPLGVALAKMTGEATFASTSHASSEPCPAAEPRAGSAASSDRASTTSSASTTSTTPARGRALLVGVSAPLTDAPVNLLFLVDERKHGELAPLTVEAIVADRFQRVVADDATRALGESGVLSMAFPTPPAERDLFGRTLTWLNLSPRPVTSNAVWTPSIRGAYLNAVWASATETLTRELLGSSDGAPFLTFRVARPPVLRDTLELRVREPLGDEERAELREDDPQKVSSQVEGLPGDWVRWDRVIDPGDEPPTARVYALDESIGEIRFGDGLHGMIPPIGRDSIVAFTYKRTEAGPDGTDIVPANAIVARTPLNLVSPVQSVEAVIAADQAAGGAPPDSIDRVVRFGFSRLRHRNRVVTARDLEDITLQSSPDIAQARAFPTRAGAKVIVVMKGQAPTPTAAQIRELRRVLLAAGPASLGEPGALRIGGPTVRPLRVDMTLRVESLDHAGAVAKRVKEQLAAFFDTAIGGLDRRGWPLGLSPGDDDIALALVDVPYLDAIIEIARRERDEEDGSVRDWPATLPPGHLAMLAADPVRIELEDAEVVA